MFTHARSAAASGQGTEVNARGLAFTPTTPLGISPLLTVEQGLDAFPVLVSVKVVNSKDFAGPAESLVVQAIPADGSAPVTIATGSEAANGVVTGEYLANGKDLIQVNYSDAMTAGSAAVFATLSGLGAP